MYARMTTIYPQPGMLDEAIRIAQDGVLPAAREQPGFKGVLALADYSTGKLIGITLWESEAAMLAGETSNYYQEQVARFRGILADNPLREAYVAVMAEWASP